MNAHGPLALWPSAPVWSLAPQFELSAPLVMWLRCSTVGLALWSPPWLWVWLGGSVRLGPGLWLSGSVALWL